MSDFLPAIKLEGSPLVLLAEDESLIREVVVMMIEDVGGRVFASRRWTSSGGLI